ncbi:hypothetical protein [Flavobacterium sp.]|uniref:hypothetical protein n=1 Tax=Flavobacterium sp. TaxID=239 RepID=UPI00262B888F|nr:hypothetical protein [Flavobacterium sp.]
MSFIEPEKMLPDIKSTEKCIVADINAQNTMVLIKVLKSFIFLKKRYPINNPKIGFTE